MKQNILNRGIIDEIQARLAELNWSENREFHSMALRAFLEGVKYAGRAGIILKLTSEYQDYKTTFRVDVSEYSEIKNAFSDKKLLFSIYEDKISYVINLKEC